MCEALYIINFDILTILSIQFSGINYIHSIVQPSPPCVSNSIPLPQTETPLPTSSNPHFPLPLDPGNL